MTNESEIANCEGLSKIINSYNDDIRQYKKQLIKGETAHHSRNESGELFPDGFSRSIFLFFDIGRYIKAKLPRNASLVFKKALNYWTTYRWGVFRVGTVKVWHRLIKILTKPNQ